MRCRFTFTRFYLPQKILKFWLLIFQQYGWVSWRGDTIDLSGNYVTTAWKWGWGAQANAYWHTLGPLSLTSMQLWRNYRKGLLNEIFQLPKILFKKRKWPRKISFRLLQRMKYYEIVATKIEMHRARFIRFLPNFHTILTNWPCSRF